MLIDGLGPNYQEKFGTIMDGSGRNSDETFQKWKNHCIKIISKIVKNLH